MGKRPTFFYGRNKGKDGGEGLTSREGTRTSCLQNYSRRITSRHLEGSGEGWGGGRTWEGRERWASREGFPLLTRINAGSIKAFPSKAERTR